MRSFTGLAFSAGLAAAQFVPPPPPVLLTTTKSGVLPVLPTPFNGVETLEGAIIAKGPANASYVGLGGPAQVQSGLPAATYVATLPSTAFNELTGTTVSGSISISSKQGDTGVTVSVNFANFPSVSQYGPFVYHIHDMPVPADGNCTETLGHFDVTNVGEYYPCIVGSPQNCQVGDLAGKHGAIMGTTFTASYVEDYLSTDPSSSYFVGTKSITIHTSNTTRLTCANFMLMSSGGNGSSTGNSTMTPTGTATSSTAPAVYTGAAARIVASSAVLGLAGFFAFLL
ncbi:hypothetical protein ANO11243_083650 [Dothideomycetidae sp. 11243]|nr:hypothetical protein ANO11243_083650 [fungal sp. No.11243]